MLDKLFEMFTAQAVKAAREVYTPAQEPPHVYILNGVKIVADPRSRSHKVTSLETFAELTSKGKDPVAWVDRAGVVLVFDDQTRRDEARFAFTVSPQLALVMAMEADAGKRNHTQKQLISTLRVMFADCMPLCPSLVESLRNVKVTQGSVTDSNVQNRGISVGRKIQSEVQGVIALPDDFTLTIPLYCGEMASLRYDIRFTLDIDASTDPAKFIITPIAGDVENALQKAEVATFSRMAELLSATPVYLGKPA